MTRNLNMYTKFSSSKGKYTRKAQ